jgi:putative phage-type endonuclease
MTVVGCSSSAIKASKDEARLSFYVIDTMEQGTPEWLSWRKGVIGASDAPTIMGENPWASPNRLLEEKLGLHPEFTGNAATREGHQLEAFARRELDKRQTGKLRPTIVQHSDDPFLAASLDGIDATNRHIFEIKCGAKAYELTRKTRTIPTYYFAQLQHMLMVTGLNSLCYAAYRPHEPMILIDVIRDERYIKGMRKKEIQFIDELVSRGHKVQNVFHGSKVH